MNEADERSGQARIIARNTGISLACKVLLIGAMFVLQRVMAETLGQANIGLSGVFSNIISLLSLAEMGISSAIVYHLYAPLAEGDRDTVAALMRLYARCYRWIALLVATLGCVIMTFVQIFLRDNSLPLSYVRTIYALYLAKAVLSYFLSYRRSLLIADQRIYIVSLIELCAQFISACAGIAVLCFTGSFAAYLACDLLCAVLGNAVIAAKAKAAYPYIVKPSPSLSPCMRKKIFSDVRNAFVMRLSGQILTSTDSLIISSFISTATAGVFSCYTQITAALNMMVYAVTDAIQPTLGRIFKQKSNSVLSELLSGYTFAFFLFASFAGVSLTCLTVPFVTGIWITPAYTLPNAVVTLLALNFFLTTLRCPLWSMMNVSGLFAKNRNAALAGATLNLFVSLALVGPLGLVGVLVGTFISQLAQVIIRIYMLFRHALSYSPRAFIGEWIGYFALYCAEAAATYALCLLTPDTGAGFIGKMLFCVLLPFSVNCLIFFRTKRFRWLITFARQGRGRKASS